MTDRPTERTLRERCIEAGAVALAANRFYPALSFEREAKNVLDAVLGVLTEHADEAIRTVYPLGPNETAIRKLLAVLGGDDLAVSDD